MTVFGVHTLLQNTTMPEVMALWRHIEELGFDWISVGDHFYSFYDEGLPLRGCHEALTAHAAVASVTSRVRVGSLVYSAAHRNPAVFAKGIATIDHISGGRAEVGIGAGWAVEEFESFGLPFPSAGVRLDVLEESVQCIAAFLHDENVSFTGEHVSMENARCEPRPVQARLPIWIGGGGEKRTLRIAARHADGWSVPFVSPADFARKQRLLLDHSADIGRDPATMRCAVSLGFNFTESSVLAQFGDGDVPFLVSGSDDRIVDQLGTFADAGADQINLTIRAPWDREELGRLAGLVLGDGP